MKKTDMMYLKNQIRMTINNKQAIKSRVEFMQKTAILSDLKMKINEYANDISDFPDCAYGELNFLCDKYGSDKGSNYNFADKSFHPYPWYPHTYTNIYEILFRSKRNTAKNVFECGIGTNNEDIMSNMSATGKPGASLRVWRDYFLDADIYGADIDRNCLFNEYKINTGYIDQTSPEAIRNYFENINKKFDVMVDDGLHTADAAICLFENANKYLDDQGIYCIEDLPLEDIAICQSYFNKHKSLFIVKYIMMENFLMPDNNLIVIKKR